MTLYEFNSMTLEEKQATVLENGIFVDNYFTEYSRVNCYAIDKFYVEVVYDPEYKAITEVSGFKYENSLDKYAPKI